MPRKSSSTHSIIKVSALVLASSLAAPFPARGAPTPMIETATPAIETPTPTATGTPTSPGLTPTSTGPSPTATSTQTPGGSTPTPTQTPVATAPAVCAILNGPFVSRRAGSAIVSWSTTDIAGGRVSSVSGPGFPTVVDPNQVIEHELSITGLSGGSHYVFEAEATCFGNPDDTTRFGSFTAKMSGLPEILEGPFVPFFGISPTRAIVVWRTESPSRAVVDFGLTTNYDLQVQRTELREDQFITLTGLVSDTDYHYRVTSCDAFDNCVSSSDHTFRTTAFSGSSVPVIVEGPSVDSFDVTDTLALVRWETDEPSTSLVRYSTSVRGGPHRMRTRFGRGPLVRTVESPALDLEHRIVLPGLEPDTQVCYEAVSRDLDGNEVVSQQDCFQTDADPDLDAPLILETPSARRGPSPRSRAAIQAALDVTYVSSDHVVLEWQTDEPASAELFLEPAVTRGGIGAMWISSGLRRRFQASVNFAHRGGGQAFTYHLRLTDVQGNVSEYESPPGTFVVLAPNPDAPAILGDVDVSYVGSDRAIVRWVTDQASTSTARVFDGLVDTGYVIHDPAPVVAHQLELTRLGGLPSQFTVHVESCNPDVRCVEDSVDAELQAPDTTAPTFVQPLAAISIGTSSAVLGWTTSEPATSEVHFQETSGRQITRTRIEPRKVVTHRVTLTRLRPGICYQVSASSADPAGNRADSADINLCTEPVSATTPTVRLGVGLLLAALGVIAVGARGRSHALDGRDLR